MEEGGGGGCTYLPQGHGVQGEPWVGGFNVATPTTITPITTKEAMTRRRSFEPSAPTHLLQRAGSTLHVLCCDDVGMMCTKEVMGEKR